MLVRFCSLLQELMNYCPSPSPEWLKHIPILTTSPALSQTCPLSLRHGSHRHVQPLILSQITWFQQPLKLSLSSQTQILFYHWLPILTYTSSLGDNIQWVINKHKWTTIYMQCYGSTRSSKYAFWATENKVLSAAPGNVTEFLELNLFPYKPGIESMRNLFLHHSSSSSWRIGIVTHQDYEICCIS